MSVAVQMWTTTIRTHTTTTPCQGDIVEAVLVLEHEDTVVLLVQVCLSQATFEMEARGQVVNSPQREQDILVQDRVMVAVGQPMAVALAQPLTCHRLVDIVTQSFPWGGWAEGLDLDTRRCPILSAMFPTVQAEEWGTLQSPLIHTEAQHTNKIWQDIHRQQDTCLVQVEPRMLPATLGDTVALLVCTLSNSLSRLS